MSTMHARPSPADAVRFAMVLVGGLAAGILAKAADESTTTGAADLGTYFGAWVVALTLIASWSRTAVLAMVHAGAFLLLMLLGYYAYAQWLGFFVPTALVVVWVAVALLLGPPFAVLVHHARGKGWVAALGVAVPAGVLLAEAYTFIHVLPLHRLQFTFDVVSAALLLALLPRCAMQRLRALVLTPIVAVVVAPLLDRLWEIAARAT